MKSSLKVVFITDIHMGHPRVPAEHIHYDLEQILYPHLNETVDVLLLGGDFFDSLLNLDGKSGYHAVMIIRELQFLAMKYNFIIRVLQGTFLHDRRQNKFFLGLPEGYDKLPDHDGVELIKFFDGLAIEQIPYLNLSLMYIPDELAYDNVLEKAQNMLLQHGLERVDIVVHHGYCAHLYPMGLKQKHEIKNVYSHEEYRLLTHGVVLNGHVHSPSVYENIISGGSFERLCHGEEEPKGFFIVDFDKTNKTWTYKFIENTLASPFVTVDLLHHNEDVESARAELNSVIAKYKENLLDGRYLHIRAITNDVNVKQTLMEYVKVRHAQVIFTAEKTKLTQVTPKDLLSTDVELPVITPANLAVRVQEHLNRDGVQMELKDIEIVLA